MNGNWFIVYMDEGPPLRGDAALLLDANAGAVKGVAAPTLDTDIYVERSERRASRARSTHPPSVLSDGDVTSHHAP